MTDEGENAADAAVLNENDASIMLLALSGRQASCGLNAEVSHVALSGRQASCGLNAEVSHVQKRVLAAEKRLEVVKMRLRLDTCQRTPGMGGKLSTFTLQQHALQAELVSLEALLVSLDVEGRYYAANPNEFSQLVHRAGV
jgi:hypothetical protein